MTKEKIEINLLQQKGIIMNLKKLLIAGLAFNICILISASDSSNNDTSPAEKSFLQRCQESAQKIWQSHPFAASDEQQSKYTKNIRTSFQEAVKKAFVQNNDQSRIALLNQNNDQDNDQEILGMPTTPTLERKKRFEGKSVSQIVEVVGLSAGTATAASNGVNHLPLPQNIRRTVNAATSIAAGTAAAAACFYTKPTEASLERKKITDLLDELAKVDNQIKQIGINNEWYQLLDSQTKTGSAVERILETKQDEGILSNDHATGEKVFQLLITRKNLLEKLHKTYKAIPENMIEDSSSSIKLIEDHYCKTNQLTLKIQESFNTLKSFTDAPTTSASHVPPVSSTLLNVLQSITQLAMLAAQVTAS